MVVAPSGQIRAPQPVFPVWQTRSKAASMLVRMEPAAKAFTCTHTNQVKDSRLAQQIPGHAQEPRFTDKWAYSKQTQVAVLGSRVS